MKLTTEFETMPIIYIDAKLCRQIFKRKSTKFSKFTKNLQSSTIFDKKLSGRNVDTMLKSSTEWLRKLQIWSLSIPNLHRNDVESNRQAYKKSHGLHDVMAKRSASHPGWTSARYIQERMFIKQITRWNWLTRLQYDTQRNKLCFALNIKCMKHFQKLEKT